MNGWMGTEVEGRCSGEGTSVQTAMLNKQCQILPHALGSYSELFDFPIHYFFNMQPPVGKAESNSTTTALDLSGCLWRRKPSGSTNAELCTHQQQPPPPDPSTQNICLTLTEELLCSFYSSSLLCVVFHCCCYWKSVKCIISAPGIPHTVHALRCY